MEGRRETGLERAGERQRSARNYRRVVDVMWDTGETWVELGKCRQQRIRSVTVDPDNLENG